MAEHAFALSPIAAKAASPTDADFEAIREAFLETARGRWFLDEYARRNRNADTAMVLEAVDRIERSLAAQKEEQRQQALLPEPAPPVDVAAVEAAAAERASARIIAAAHAIVVAARDNALTALSEQRFEDALSPSRKCARVIKEIAWGLRESGADGRICSLLDSQVDAINAACDHVATGGLRDSVVAAFEAAEQQIGAIAGTGANASTVSEAPQAIPNEAADVIPETQIAHHEAIASNVVAFQAAPADIATPAIAEDELFEVADVIADRLADETTAEDGIPAADDFDVVDTSTETPPQAGHGEISPDLNVSPAVAEVAPQPQASAMSSDSLGASLIAQGLVARAAPSRPDPLAPFRRMSQAEKVAFFS